MKRYWKGLTAASVLALSTLGTAPAAAEFGANVALTSDYVFRGFSQTEGRPAVQGGFFFTHDAGIYAGVWASNV